MKQMRSVRWFLACTISACAVLGGVYGQRLEAVSSDTGPDNVVLQSIDAFAKVYDLVQKDYADPVNRDRGIFGPEGSGTLGAIPGMLRTLDPHSNFFDAGTFARLRATQEGKYYCVGMRILTVPDTMGQWMTTVVEPMPSCQAFSTGLRPCGDMVR